MRGIREYHFTALYAGISSSTSKEYIPTSTPTEIIDGINKGATAQESRTDKVTDDVHQLRNWIPGMVDESCFFL